MGLGAFAIAVLAGLAADNPSEQILYRALVAMVTCHAVGLLVGFAGERGVAEAVAAYIAARPLPERQRPGAPPAKGPAGVEEEEPLVV